MAVDARRQLQFWGIGLAVFVLVLWLLGSTLLPFLLGAAVAYFLDPLADRLERLGLSRALATGVIAVIAVLVFVLALVLLVRGTRRLLLTITAFTAAHSLTLAGATLGWVHVPGPPVEAAIALSIVFVASEIVHARQGRYSVTQH